MHEHLLRPASLVEASQKSIEGNLILWDWESAKTWWHPSIQLFTSVTEELFSVLNEGKSFQTRTWQLSQISKATRQDLRHLCHLPELTCWAWASNSWHLGRQAKQMRRYKWLHCRAALGLAGRTKKNVLESMQTHTNTTHTPLIPGRSMLACSWIPMPLRMIRREPSLNAPEQVTSWKQKSQMRTGVLFSCFPVFHGWSSCLPPKCSDITPFLLLWDWCIKDPLNLYLEVEIWIFQISS